MAMKSEYKCFTDPPASIQSEKYASISLRYNDLHDTVIYNAR